MMVQLCLDQSRDVNHVVCADVMCMCDGINYNKFKTGPAHYHISVVIEIC